MGSVEGKDFKLPIFSSNQYYIIRKNMVSFCHMHTCNLNTCHLRPSGEMACTVSLDWR